MRSLENLKELYFDIRFIFFLNFSFNEVESKGGFLLLESIARLKKLLVLKLNLE